MNNGKILGSSRLKLLALFVVLVTMGLLASCGDDAFTTPSETTDNTTPPPPPPPPSPLPSPSPSPPPPPPPPTAAIPHTIALSYSQSSSVEHLGGGIYRRAGTAIVTDADGHAVADGTIVQLGIIDSVIAQGKIDAGDSIQGNAITDSGVLDGGSIASLFTGANVIRNAAVRYIQPGDHIFLTFAEEQDKDRIVNLNGVLDNQISVTQNYSRDYPDTVDYQPGAVGYLIGASLLGAEISGQDLNGNLVSGYAMTKQGIATFYVTYPANVNTILSGCYDDPAIDTRAIPAGSAQVYLVASVSSAVTTIDNQFCFTSIAGGTLYAIPQNITTTGTVRVTYEDGGDTVQLPFALLNVSVSDANGSNITINGGADKSVNIRTNDLGTATFTVQINTPPTTGNATITIVSLFDPDVASIEVTVSSNTVTP
ncbi:MAG: hypothetical protein L0Z73_06830 [Gammaproteobacteria bacterium]|nr:hypothetical protein [Gammaproteobacteria bacterium]